MKLFANVRDYGNADMAYHHEKNKEIVKEVICSGTMPEEIHIINDIPEMNFCEELINPSRPENVWLPVQLILEDLMDDNSALNWFYESRGDAEKKADLFLKIWEQLMTDRFASGKGDTTGYDVWYADPVADKPGAMGGENKGPTFVAEIPDELVKKYYPNPECYISELKGLGYQQFFDLHKLDRDEFAKYVASAYYNDLSMWDREKTRGNAVVRKNWIGNLFAALH